MIKRAHKCVLRQIGTALAISCLAALGLPVSAQWVVIDPANIYQTTASAVANVANTAKQIQQYQTQLQQYENMLKNTLHPSTQIWDDAKATMTNLRQAVDTLQQYKAQLGSIDNYLSKFKDTASYRNSPCFSEKGCSAAQLEELQASNGFASEAQKKANDAAFRGLDQQQDAMIADANKLKQLQAAAENAEGQLAAIGFANQLASHQSNQLLQIRGLLAAEHNVMITRQQVVADREAKQQLARERLYRLPTR